MMARRFINDDHGQLFGSQTGLVERRKYGMATIRTPHCDRWSMSGPIGNDYRSHLLDRGPHRGGPSGRVHFTIAILSLRYPPLRTVRQCSLGLVRLEGLTYFSISMRKYRTALAHRRHIGCRPGGWRGTRVCILLSSIVGPFRVEACTRPSLFVLVHPHFLPRRGGEVMTLGIGRYISFPGFVLGA